MSNSKTQTFSEDQIPSLTDLTTTTKATTTLSENEVQNSNLNHHSSSCYLPSHEGWLLLVTCA
jgi:hypothetical protein